MARTNEASFMSVALNEFRSARKLVPHDPTSPILIHHDHRIETPEPAYEYLRGHGMPAGDIELVFDPTSQLKRVEGESIDPYSLDQFELEHWVKRRLTHIYRALDWSLNTSSPYGFNEHGQPHAEEILGSTRHLLSGLGINDPDVQRRSTIEALIHDLGNLPSRHHHVAGSISLSERALPELKKDRGQWKLIKQAILFHNISFLEKLWDKDANAEEKIKILKDTFCTDALALFVADKTSIGRGRLPTIPIPIDSVDADMHIALNLLASGAHTNFSEDRSVFTWLIDFSPEPNGETDRGNIDNLFVYHAGHPETPLAYVPNSWHSMHRKDGIPHMSSWYSSFMQTYSDRLELAVLASFALNPAQEIFELCVQEKIGESSVSTMGEQINRRDIDTVLATLRRKHFPKARRRSER